MTAETIAPHLLPAHIGVVMDGNRRWAKKAGFSNPGAGHDVGADHVADLLEWCTRWQIDHLTSYVLSADNIRKRPKSQVDHLFGILADKLPKTVVRSDRWALHVSGDLSLLPDDAAEALRAAERETADRPAHLTMAIGYDPHGDIVEGIRRAIAAGVTQIDEQAITAALPGGPVKEIDLVIRTSGEQRLSGFFPWQTSNAEIIVSEKLWPDFTDADFAEALVLYAERRSSVVP